TVPTEHAWMIDGRRMGQFTDWAKGGDVAFFACPCCSRASATATTPSSAVPAAVKNTVAIPNAPAIMPPSKFAATWENAFNELAWPTATDWRFAAKCAA